jgi:hypothetical protein
MRALPVPPRRLVCLGLALLLTTGLAGGCHTKAPAPAEGSADRVAGEGSGAAKAPVVVWTRETCEAARPLLSTLTARPAGDAVGDLQARLLQPAELTDAELERLRDAGAAAAPLAELLAARVRSASAEKAAQLLTMLQGVAPEAAIRVAEELVSDGSGSENRLRLSVGASALAASGDAGLALLVKHLGEGGALPESLRASRIERAAAFPAAAAARFFGAGGWCAGRGDDAGCAGLRRVLEAARPGSTGTSEAPGSVEAITRLEAAALRDAAAMEALLTELSRPGSATTVLSMPGIFQRIAPYVEGSRLVPVVLRAMSPEPAAAEATEAGRLAPLRLSQLASWLNTRVGDLRAQVEPLRARSESPGLAEPWLVVAATVRVAAGDRDLPAAVLGRLGQVADANPGQQGAVAELLLARLGKRAELKHRALAAETAGWTALLGATTGEQALAAAVAPALAKAPDELRLTALVLWAGGRPAELATALAARPDLATEPLWPRLAARLGPEGSPVARSLWAAAPDASRLSPMLDIAAAATPEQAAAWVAAALSSGDAGDAEAGVRLALLTNAKVPAQALLPLMTRRFDLKAPAALATHQLPELSYVKLLRQRDFDPVAVRDERARLQPGDAGFTQLGLLLFSATESCPK